MTTLLLKGLLVAALFSTAHSHDAEQKPLTSDDYTCVHPPYKAQILSRSPLVIYLTDFITPEEREHMLNLAQDTFEHSAVVSPDGTIYDSIRTSSSTTLPSDPVTLCVEARAAAFQGPRTSPAHVEPLQLVRYNPAEHYHYHTDWFPDASRPAASQGGQRVSSFFAYVGVGGATTGGGTNFPALDAPHGEEWCGVVDCDEEYERGVTFRPVEGNAVYWENVVGGEGDERTLHAGLPVTGGWKVGMNIWTREGPLGEEYKPRE